MAPLWLLVLTAALVLYALTAQRGVGWQDSGDYQMRAIDGELSSGNGLATDHPLYVLMGHVLSLPSPRALPFLLNLCSGLGTALALANLAALLLLVTGRRWVAALIAGILAGCHTLWWLATVAEVYPWVIAGLTAEMWLLYRLLRQPSGGTAVLLAFVNGLGLAIHNLALLPLPVYASVVAYLIWRKMLPRWSAAAAVAAWVLGAGLYLVMALQLVIHTGSVTAAVKSALFGEQWFRLVVGSVEPIPALLRVNFGLMAINFVNPLLPLAVVGWLNLKSSVGRLGAFAFGMITVIHIVFVSRYFVSDQFTFLLPTLVMIAFAAGIGLRALAARGDRWKRVLLGLCCLSVVSQPFLLAASPAIVWRLGFDTSRDRPLKYRDEARYWLIPWKQKEDSAFRWAYETLEWASRGNGVLLTDSTTLNALLFVQRYWQVGRNVTIVRRGSGIPDFGRDMAGFRRAIGDRPLYVLSDSPRYLDARYGPLMKSMRVEKSEGDLLYRLRWLTSEGDAAPPNPSPRAAE